MAPIQSIAERERLRHSYKPSKIRFLFIAESPPNSGGFFYNPKTIGRDSLFAETMRTLRLWPENKTMSKGFDKRPLLKRFQSMKYYLLDSSQTPVDKLGFRERNRKVRGEIPRLIREIKKLKPDKIVLVKKNVFQIVGPALVKEDFAVRVLNKTFLAFPSHGNQLKYRRHLRRLLD